MSRRTYCFAPASTTGRRCRSFGCWRTSGPSELYCKRHAQEVAAFTDDPRIVNVTTGRIEMVDPRRLNLAKRTGPPPEGVEQITAELRTVRSRHDFLRCYRAIFTDLPAVLDMRTDKQGLVYAHSVNRDVAAALGAARRRLRKIGATQ